MKKERNVNSYSSDGRIYQLEYAMKAVSLGTTTIGIKVKDGVIVGSEKKIVTSLQLPESVKKHYRLYDHCGFAFSGLSGDARTIVRKARELCINHEFVFKEKIPVEGIVKELSAISLNFGEADESRKIFSRPFGISALICGHDGEPRLYALDPSGTYVEYWAKSIGSAAEAVTSEMDGKYKKDLSVEEGTRLVLALLKSVMKDPITSTNCEIMVCTGKGIEFFTAEKIQELL